MTRRSAAVLACAALACARPARAQDGDTAAVIVRGPTVVACWVPVSAARIERDGNGAPDAWMEQVMSWQVSQPFLRRAGIVAERRDARVVWLAWDGRLRAVPCPGVGYVLAEPARQPKVLRGVMTDVDLARAAAAYFRRPDLVPGGIDARQR